MPACKSWIGSSRTRLEAQRRLDHILGDGQSGGFGLRHDGGMFFCGQAAVDCLVSVHGVLPRMCFATQ